MYAAGAIPCGAACRRRRVAGGRRSRLRRHAARAQEVGGAGSGRRVGGARGAAGSALEPVRPIQRYERRRPGTLVHLDVKKLGKIGRVGHRMHGDRTTRVRGIGWEYVHVAIDDCTRMGYAEVLADEQGESAAAFLARVVAWYAALGITVRRLLTDNGGSYRSAAFQACCRQQRIRDAFTRPYRPPTNGKAERFIRTLLHEWAYAQAYGRSVYRTRALPTYLRFYNIERRHTALGFLTPLQRLAAKL